VTAVLPEEFAHDPIASHSARFPLGQVAGPLSQDRPSPRGVRPWGLVAMRPARAQGDPVREAFTYDPITQTSVDAAGRPLVTSGTTANKVTSNDGDEGPSEDYTYDFCPDSPYPV